MEPDGVAMTAPVAFVTGKGGVGKTTVAAGLALRAASAGHRTALVVLGDGASGERALGSAGRDVRLVVVRFEEAVVAAVAGILGSKALARLLVGHYVVRRLVAAAPGIVELAELEAVRALVAGGDLDRVIVDLPSSGHAVGWLGVAGAVARFARVGPFFDMAARIDRMVRDPSRSAVVVVAIPEPLVLRETAELCASLDRELGRRPDLVVVNRMPPDDGEAPVRTLRDLARNGGSAPHAREVLDLLEARAAASLWARRALAEARLPRESARVVMPESPTDPDPARILDWLRGIDQGVVRWPA